MLGSFQVVPASRVLVVDDEPSMQRMIVNYLNAHNMRSSAVGNRKDMLRAFVAEEPDVVILDLHLGQEDGLDLLRDIRAKSTVPVILITGHRVEEIDQVVGLELGADDYIMKPFGLRELLARLRALLRRRSLEQTTPGRSVDRRKFSFAGWLFEPRVRQLRTPDGQDVSLTKGEFALLSAFVAAPQRPLSREQLLQATRVHEDVFDRSIDVQILRLRRKLDQNAGAPSFIRTERGVGYIFEPEVTVS
jgi:DNA-binding response OmpR family regulator